MTQRCTVNGQQWIKNIIRSKSEQKFRDIHLNGTRIVWERDGQCQGASSILSGQHRKRLSCSLKVMLTIGKHFVYL